GGGGGGGAGSRWARRPGGRGGWRVRWGGGSAGGRPRSSRGRSTSREWPGTPGRARPRGRARAPRSVRGRPAWSCCLREVLAAVVDVLHEVQVTAVRLDEVGAERRLRVPAVVAPRRAGPG